MNNRELYKQAFGALHGPDTISLDKGYKKSRPVGRAVAVCACAVMIFALAVTAYAHGEQVLKRILGWGNNMEVTVGIDEQGEEFSQVAVHTDHLTDPVVLQDGKMLFVVNGERLDITDWVSQVKSFRYEYLDKEGNTHLWLVGLNSEDLENFGYAEYIKGADGAWAAGYSARVNIEADGKTNAQWLEISKKELNIPW